MDETYSESTDVPGCSSAYEDVTGASASDTDYSSWYVQSNPHVTPREPLELETPRDLLSPPPAGSVAFGAGAPPGVGEGVGGVARAQAIAGPPRRLNRQETSVWSSARKWTAEGEVLESTERTTTAAETSMGCGGEELARIDSEASQRAPGEKPWSSMSSVPAVPPVTLHLDDAGLLDGLQAVSNEENLSSTTRRRRRRSMFSSVPMWEARKEMSEACGLRGAETLSSGGEVPPVKLHPPQKKRTGTLRRNRATTMSLSAGVPGLGVLKGGLVPGSPLPHPSHHGDGDIVSLRRSAVREMERARQAQNIQMCDVTIVDTTAQGFVALTDELILEPNVHLEDREAWIGYNHLFCVVVPCSSDVFGGWASASPAIQHLKSMFGAALVDLLTELVTLNYLGEIPPGTTIMVRPSTNMHVVFVVLSTTGVCASPTEHYTAVRAALLRIRSHNYDLTLGRAPTEHYYLDEALRQQEHAIRHLVLSAFPALGCSEAGVALAVALAYKSLSSPSLDGCVRREKLLSIASCTDQDWSSAMPSRLLKLLKCGVLARRGLATTAEAAELFKLFTNEDEIAILAMKSFAEMILSGKKPIIPFALAQARLRGVLSLNPDAFGCVLRAGKRGDVSYCNVIEKTAFKLRNEIGSDSTSVLYKCEWCEKPCVVKQLAVGADPAGIRAQANIMSLIYHPNLVQLLGCSLDVPEPYLVTEATPLGPLSSLMRPENGLSFDAALHVAVQISRGLAHLHSLQLLHGNLNSSNVVVFENQVAKLNEYGVPCAPSVECMARSSGPLGQDPRFIAPEVFETSAHTDKSDIYSLAMILYEMFVGKPPFEDVMIHLVASAAAKGKRPHIPLSVPKSIAKIIESMWVGKPARRPSAARVLGLLDGIQRKKLT